MGTEPDYPSNLWYPLSSLLIGLSLGIAATSTSSSPASSSSYGSSSAQWSTSRPSSPAFTDASESYEPSAYPPDDASDALSTSSSSSPCRPRSSSASSFASPCGQTPRRPSLEAPDSPTERNEERTHFLSPPSSPLFRPLDEYDLPSAPPESPPARDHRSPSFSSSDIPSLPQPTTSSTRSLVAQPDSSFLAGGQEEKQYLDLVQLVIERGELRSSVKNGAGALALFAPPPLKFSLSHRPPSADLTSPPTLLVPLLTTKQVSFKTVAGEFVWMLGGCTDSKVLSEKGIRIWDANGSRAYLDKVGLRDRAEGDLGPVYGFQWRHFGAEYGTAKDSYEGKGVDQLAEVIRKIKDEPEKRRLVISAWNPADTPKMALPPCPILIQFFVHSLPPSSVPSSKPGLSCCVYQRSADLGLGLPYDFVTYSLLTHTVARLTDTVPQTLTFQLGDAHVYLDHIEPLRTQLERTPKGWPELRWTRPTEELKGVDDVKETDWEVVGYEPADRIRLALHP
ncbi:hypothetical protein JCM8097_007492 [Rhodosporidiobolus ruineniae]